jgi:hypothetical protein
MNTIVIIWLVLGLIGVILTLIDIKHHEGSIKVKHICSAPLAVIFGLIFLIIALANVEMFKGFWDKKIF